MGVAPDRGGVLRPGGRVLGPWGRCGVAYALLVHAEWRPAPIVGGECLLLQLGVELERRDGERGGAMGLLVVVCNTRDATADRQPAVRSDGGVCG